MWPSRQRNSSSWSSRSSRSPLSSRLGTASPITWTILRANSRSTTVSTDLPGDERHHLPRVELLEMVLVVGQDALGGEHHQHRVVALEGGEDVGVGLQRGESVDGHVAGPAAALAAGLDRLRSRARWSSPSAPRPATRARAGRGRAGPRRSSPCGSARSARPGRSAARRSAPAAASAGAGGCGSRGSATSSSPSGGPNCRRRSPWRTAIVSALLAALTDAAETHTRPWTSVPSIVKKRLPALSIGLGSWPSSPTSP